MVSEPLGFTEPLNVAPVPEIGEGGEIDTFGAGVTQVLVLKLSVVPLALPLVAVARTRKKYVVPHARLVTAFEMSTALLPEPTTP